MSLLCVEPESIDKGRPMVRVDRGCGARSRLAELSPPVRAAVLAELDAITRPLSAREIEVLLLGRLTRSQRRHLLAGLRDVTVIAIVETPQR